MQTCQSNSSITKFKADTVMEVFDKSFNITNNYINMLAAVAVQPIVALMEVPSAAPNYGLDFYSYASGIYITPYCGTCVPKLNADGSINAAALSTCLNRLNHGKL